MKVSFTVECEVDLKAADIISATGYDMPALLKLVKKMGPLSEVSDILAALMDATPQQKFFLLMYGLDSLMLDTKNLIKDLKEKESDAKH